jgi:5-methylcytosine-specific restriction endonuclease McrA
MAWESSDRASRLPPDWKQRVAKVWERDKGRCTWKLPKSGQRCPRKGAEVDHIRNDDNHELRNLRLLCKHHHDQKTQREAWFGKQRRKPKKRPEEPHPGRLR